MSLIVYGSLEIEHGDVKEEVIQNASNIFFNTCKLEDNILVNTLLEEVEHAERVSDFAFISKIHPDWASHPIHELSLGFKTAMSIYNNKELCFSLDSCGRNYITRILQFDRGKIMWERYYHHDIFDNIDCDIIVGGKHCNKMYDFFEEVKWLC